VRISVVVVLFIMLVASALGQTSKIVYIGAALPLTGILQSYGIGAKNAVELAVEDANKMCPNFEFKLLVEDTGTDPQQALQKLQTLYAKGARLIVGPMSSREASALKSFADQNKILIFSPSSTSPLLAIPGDWVYRIVPTDLAQAMAIADLLKHLGIKRAVIIYRNDAWGVGLSNAIVDETKKLGIQIAASEGYDPDPKAFPTAVPEVIRKLSAALGQPGLDAAIIFVTFEDDGIAAVQAAAQDPVLSKVRWIGTDGFAYSEAMIKQVGKEMAAGKMLGTVVAPDPNDPKYQQFKQAYKARYGKDPVAYDPYSYDAAMMLAQIVCSIGTDDPVKVRETLEQWSKEGKYQGATGKVYLDAAGDRAYPNYVIWGVALEGGTPKYIDAAYYYGTERRFSIWSEELIPRLLPSYVSLPRYISAKNTVTMRGYVIVKGVTLSGSIVDITIPFTTSDNVLSLNREASAPADSPVEIWVVSVTLGGQDVPVKGGGYLAFRGAATDLLAGLDFAELGLTGLVTIQAVDATGTPRSDWTVQVLYGDITAAQGRGQLQAVLPRTDVLGNAYRIRVITNAVTPNGKALVKEQTLTLNQKALAIQIPVSTVKVTLQAVDGFGTVRNDWPVVVENVATGMGQITTELVEGQQYVARVTALGFTNTTFFVAKGPQMVIRVEMPTAKIMAQAVDGFGNVRSEWSVQIDGVAAGQGEVGPLEVLSGRYTVRTWAFGREFSRSVEVSTGQIAVIQVRVPTARLTIAVFDDAGRQIDDLVTAVELAGPLALGFSSPPKNLEVLAGTYTIKITGPGWEGATQVTLQEGEIKNIPIVIHGAVATRERRPETTEKASTNTTPPEGEFTWLVKILHDPDFWAWVFLIAVVGTLIILAIPAITERGKGPPEGPGESSRSVCQVFCRAWKKAAQLASYAEGGVATNEKTREDFMALLSQLLGELESVKFKLSREEAKELDYIRREVESIIETINHIGITTLTYREIHYIHSRLKIIGEKLNCSCK
jgi:branched-chain amino acid transport system substrate-binding protein